MTGRMDDGYGARSPRVNRPPHNCRNRSRAILEIASNMRCVQQMRSETAAIFKIWFVRAVERLADLHQAREGANLLDHLVGGHEQFVRHGEAEHRAKAPIRWLSAEGVIAPRCPMVGSLAVMNSRRFIDHLVGKPAGLSGRSGSESGRRVASCLPRLPTAKIAHLDTAGDCCTAGF